MVSIDDFVDRIKANCRAKGVSAAKMLADLNLNKDLLNSAKKRNTLPSAENIIKISGYIGILIDWLLTGEGEMKKSTSEQEYESVILQPGQSELIEYYD
ncbi:MAG: helix-turn-helix domain containing protein [Clostridiales bacterium]|jgi:transcriptional regulator with XRE-family HTH domain|nr:helix-turn-helix domain containing protein [Clostridiales bacterium]